MVSSPTIAIAQHVLLVGAVVLLAGSLCGMLARRIGVPDIVLYLLAGVVLGPAVGHIIDVPANSALSQVVLLFGASYILFDGGATLRFSVLREVWVTVLLLATIGVVSDSRNRCGCGSLPARDNSTRCGVARGNDRIHRSGYADSSIQAGPGARARGTDGDQ